MPKTVLKAFAYSFSVSLFAIMAANRAFWYEKPTEIQPLDIKDKSIVLFLKDTSASPYPVKKIALNVLPEVTKQPLDDKSHEVILADTLDNFDFPLEIERSIDPIEEKIEDNNKVILADVLYSPDKPLESPKIETEAVYTPQTAPQKKADVKIVAAKVYNGSEQEEQLLPKKNVVKYDDISIPLQDDKQQKILLADKQIKIGDPQKLNHVALNEKNIPIESMEKELKKSSTEKDEAVEQQEWKSLKDSPWEVAQIGGKSKNRLSSKATNDEIKKHLSPEIKEGGVKVAAETVKNLIIPIPEEIIKDENLTPTLAYPATSEDAKKEKIIEAKIKNQEKIKEAKEHSEKRNTALLSAIEDEDIEELTTPPSDAEKTKEQPLVEDKQKKAEPAKEEKPTILRALNSVFGKQSSEEEINQAKERALAKAKIKRSISQKGKVTKRLSIMPTEIRLSFQPNRAEISGQTLRWVQAFAGKIAETPDAALEIRIDGTSSTNLQQKRLNLLYNILTNKGLDYAKINTVFTSREPNSFVLRTIKSKNKGGTNGKINTINSPQHIQW